MMFGHLALNKRLAVNDPKHGICQSFIAKR